MKHEPRQAIHVEKQLGWACKLGGMESQVWHQLDGSVGEGFRKGTMTSACLDARHFSSSF